MIIHNATSEHSAITFDHPRTYRQLWDAPTTPIIPAEAAPNGGSAGVLRHFPSLSVIHGST
jgi:hypothetical protein